MNSVDELNYLLGIGPPKPRLPVTLTKSGYSSVRALGKGSFGQAFLVFHKEKGKYYVVKHVNMINMNSRQRRDAHNEIAVLQQLNHPNIVRYVECYEEHPHLYIVMEYADGGDLYTHLEKINRLKNPTLLRRPDQSGGGGLLTEPQVISLFVQTTMAVKYMHDRRLLHRDIKSQNVFLTHNHVVKLGDFGIATVLQNTVAMASTMCGTPCYFSPELCQGKAYNNKSDIWALGVLLYELCAGRLPFESTTMKALMREIVSREPRRIPGAYTDDLWQLIRWMLKKDPQSRPDAGQVLLTPVLMRHVPDIMAQLKSATMDDIYPRHVQPPSVRAESVGEEDSTDYSGGECAVADTAPYRQLLAHQQDGMRDGKLVMPPGAGNNPFAGAIAPSTAGGGYVSSARPPPAVAPEAEAPPEKMITSQQATKTNSPSTEHGSAPRKSSGESAQSRPSPRAPSPPGLFSSPRKSPAGAPGLSPGAAAAKAMAEKAQRQVDSSRVHSSRKVPSPAPAASPEVTHNKSKSSSAVRGPEAEDNELGAVLLEMTLHLTDFEKSVKAHAAADDINDENAPKASPQGTPPNKIIKGGPATLPNDKSPPPSSRSPHVSPDTKRNRQDASAPTSAKVDTTPKTDFSDPMGAKLDVEGLQENHRSAVSPPHSSPERGSTDGRSDMQRSINTKFNASRSGGASSSQRLGVKPSDPEAGNTSSRSNSHRQQSSKTSTSGAAASEAKEVNKTACPEPCSVGEDVSVGADRDGEDVPFSGSCLCQQAQLRGWLSTIYGSFLCACEACCRVSGASRSTGVEWLHLPNVEHMKEVVCCRSGDDSAAGKGATAARRLTDPEAAKVWLNKAGIRQYAFNLMVSDDDEDEEVSTTPGRRRPASFDVFFCTQCGCTLGMKHDGVDGLILAKSTLDSESAATLLKFAYPAE